MESMFSLKWIVDGLCFKACTSYCVSTTSMLFYLINKVINLVYYISKKDVLGWSIIKLREQMAFLLNSMKYFGKM